MGRKRIIQLLITLVFAFGASAYLLYSGFDDTVVYYKTVDELLANPARFKTRPVRINGRLVPGSVQVKPGTSLHRFSLEKRDKKVVVTFEGILPDTMSEGQDLVVQGTFNASEQEFVATEVLTKCPSKYEAEAAAIQ